MLVGSTAFLLDEANMIRLILCVDAILLWAVAGITNIQFLLTQ